MSNKTKDLQPTEADLSITDLGAEDLQQMIIDKTKENADLLAQLAQAKEETVKIKSRALVVHEKNEQLSSAPQLAMQRGQMDLDLQMCDKFFRSGALGKFKSPEQIYVVVMTGREMNMSPMEALNSLYIVNGTVKPYGPAMSRKIRQAGYKISYIDETENGVTVHVFKQGESYREVVTKNDQILKKSKAMEFAKKNKMRWHGLRMIIDFHLPHLFTGLPGMFDEYAIEQQALLVDQPKDEFDLEAIKMKKEKERLIKHIDKAGSLEDLKKVSDYVEVHSLQDLYAEKLKTFIDNDQKSEEQ